MITRIVAIQNLEKFKGQDLKNLALERGISVLINGKINKGWKGLTLELLAGLSNDNKKAPNGLGFELKSTAFIQRNSVWHPKETCAITMINQNELKNTEFYESHCWEKLKSLVYCAVSWYGRGNTKSELIDVKSFDFLTDDDIIQEIKADYDFIREKLINSGFSSLTGKDGKWIQARTKGPGHGSTSRAFYARKNLIKAIFN